MTNDEYGSLALFFIALLLAIALGPWVLLALAEWLLSPRTGSWVWQAHAVGAAWFVIVAVFWLTSRFRS